MRILEKVSKVEAGEANRRQMAWQLPARRVEEDGANIPLGKKFASDVDKMQFNGRSRHRTHVITSGEGVLATTCNAKLVPTHSSAETP